MAYLVGDLKADCRGVRGSTPFAPMMASARASVFPSNLTPTQTGLPAEMFGETAPFPIPENAVSPPTQEVSMRHCTVPVPSNRFLLLPGLLVVLGLLASAVVASAAADIVDPCKLATAAEVQAVLGSAGTPNGMRPPARPDKSPVRICAFTGQNGDRLTIYVGPRTKEKFDHERAGHDPVPGVGDAAYYIAPGTISFLKGNTNVLLSAAMAGASRDKMTTLALAVAKRL